MAEVIEGGCRCARVRYRIRSAGWANAYACHCRDCQTWSGSAFSLNLVVPEGSFETLGELAAFELISGDGKRVSRQLACATCFTRLFNTNTARPGAVVVRAGTLDRSNELKIVAHIWTIRKMDGITIPDDVAQWRRSAPLEEISALLSSSGHSHSMVPGGFDVTS